MSDAADILAQRKGLSALADMAKTMARACFERHEAASDPEAKDRALAAFEICARSARLSILCSVRLSTAGAARFAAANDPRPQGPRTDADRDGDRDRHREHDRERERDTDGHPMTALGRAEALHAALPRHPDLDPDGRVAARVIAIKARLQDAKPPAEPSPSPPSSAQDHPPGALNRAERRWVERQRRRASG